jgi:hypothetical protein
MHDSIRLEKLGIPTVTVAQANFEAAALTQGKLMGLPTIRLAVMPRTSADWDESKKREVTGQLAEAVEVALAAPKLEQPPIP